jgi:maltose O-acetyltransferase
MVLCFYANMLRHLVNSVLYILPPSHLFSLRRHLLRLAGINMSERSCICGRGWIYGRGLVSIGADTWLSPGVIFYSHLNAEITIEDRCDIGPGVEFITGGHLIGTAMRRAGQGTAIRIRVGAGSWIGAGSRILGGVSVGKGAVVAAGSVVITDVPANTLVAGVPAQIKSDLP